MSVLDRYLGGYFGYETRAGWEFFLFKLLMIYQWLKNGAEIILQMIQRSRFHPSFQTFPTASLTDLTAIFESALI